MLEDLGDAALDQTIPIVSDPRAPDTDCPCWHSISMLTHGPSSRTSRNLSSARSSSGASTTATTLPPLTTMSRTRGKRPPKSRSGIRSSCRWTRRCFSRSFSYAPHPPQSSAPVDESTDVLPQASNYLDIKPLLDVGCKTVANMIKGKSPEEIRKVRNITVLPHFPMRTNHTDVIPDVQHHQRLHTRRGGADSSRERMGRGPIETQPSFCQGGTEGTG